MDYSTNPNVKLEVKFDLIFFSNRTFLKASYTLAIFLFITFYSIAQNISDTTLINQYFDSVDLLYEAEKYDSIPYHLKIIISLSESIKDKKSQQQALSDLGYYYALTEDYQNSFLYFKEALDFSLNYNSTDTTFLSAQLYFLAYIKDQIGDYDQSLSFLKKALQYNNSPKNKIAKAEIINGIANIYLRKHDYDQALNYQQQALLLYEKDRQKHLIEIANIWDEIGLLWFYKQSYSKAFEYSSKAIKIIETSSKIDDFIKIKAYNNYSLIQIKRKQYDLAELYLDKAFQLHNQEKVEQFIENSWFNKAYLFFEKGNTKKASEAFKKAIKLFHKKYPDGHQTLGKAYYYLGQIEQQKKAYKNALSYYQLAIQVFVPNFKSDDYLKSPNLEQYIRSHRNLMRCLSAKATTLSLFQNLKNEKQIIPTKTILANYDMAIQLADQMRDEFLAEDSQYFLAVETKTLYELAVDFCYEKYEESKDLFFLEKAFNYIERGQTPILQKEQYNHQVQKIGGVPKNIIEKEKTVKLNLAYYKNKWLKAINDQDSSRIQLYANYYFSYQQQNEEIQNNLRIDYPAYLNFHKVINNIQLDELRNELDRKSLFLQFFPTRNALYRIGVSKKEYSFTKINQLDSIENYVQTLTNILHHPKFNDVNSFQMISYALFQQLFKKFTKESLYSYQSLIITTKGKLDLIPFAVLLKEKKKGKKSSFLDLAYLINDFNISHQFSAHSFLRHKNLSQLNTEAKVLAFAPFASDEIQNSNDIQRRLFSPLPYTQKEINLIKNSFSTDAFTGSNCSKSIFMNNVKDYPILHLATHAKIDYTNPERSYLSFFDSGMSSDTTHLYQYEIQNQDINAELVVLSACQTGSGKMDIGEGHLSLARAFFYTGAKTVLMTRWQVNDRSSSFLIDRFYHYLQTGNTKDAALRKTKLNYLKNEADIKTAHPFYWAGFSLIGNTQKLDNAASNTHILFTIIGVFIFILGLFRLKR